MSIASRLSSLVTQRNTLAAKLSGRGVTASQSESFSSLIGKIDSIPAAPAELAGTLSVTGSYANSTYYTASGCRLGYNPALGEVYVILRGGSSSSYENIYFTAGTLPAGVTLAGQSVYNYASAATQQYFLAILTGVTGRLNVTCNLNNLNATYDYVQCALSGSYE